MESEELKEQSTPSEATNKISDDFICNDSKPSTTTNCLALTIQEEHKLVAVKNLFLGSIRMSWKVAISTITLAILRLLS